MLKKTIIKICLKTYSKVKSILKKSVMGKHQAVTTAPMKFFKMKAQPPSLMNLRLQPLVRALFLPVTCVMTRMLTKTHYFSILWLKYLKWILVRLSSATCVSFRACMMKLIEANRNVLKANCNL